MSSIRRGLARVPWIAAAGGCVAGVVSADLGWSLYGIGLLAVGLLMAVRGRRWLLVSGLAAWALLWWLHGSRLATQREVADWAAERSGQEVVMEGVVTSLRDEDGFLPRATFEVGKTGDLGTELRHGIVVVRGLPDEVKPGDRLRLRGAVTVPAAVRNPGEFDRGEWMRTRGIAAEMRAKAVERIGPPASSLLGRRVAWDLRLQLRERIVSGLSEESVGASLIRGLVLGERGSGGTELFGAFRKSGTMHVFAVSGLHVGLVGALGWILIRLLRVPRTWGLWVVLMVIWSYAFVTGLRPPALRASLMASVFLLGFVVKRRPSLANSLLASMPPVLLLDSFQLRQVGFQLSYVVVGAIILVAPALYRLVRRFVEGDPFLPRVLYTRGQKWSRAGREKVLGFLAVSVAAWCGSMPLIVWHFGLVTPAAVLASALLVPMVFLILSVALVGVVVGVVSGPLEEGMNRANGVLAEGAYRFAKGVSEVPGSHLELQRHRGWADGILVFDLWNGDGAVYCGAGEGLLIDAGSDDEFYRVVAPALREAGRAPQSLAASHPDGGHVGGLGPAMARYGSRQLLLPVAEARSPFFRRLLAVAADRDCALHIAGKGDRYPLAKGVVLEILWTADAEPGGRADDRGMVLLLHWHGWRILVTGDAGFETEKELLAAGVDVRADVWIMGRHESDFTGTLEFVRAVAPRVLVVGQGEFTGGQLFPARWSEVIEAEGIDLWSQAETGAVAMAVGEKRLEMRSFIDPKRKRVLENDE